MENNTEQQVEEKVPTTEEEEVKTFTEEEVAKLVQAESDRRVTKALEKKQSEWKEQFQAQLEEEKRLASLSEEEKWKEQFEAERQKFEQERLEFQKAQMRASVLETLSKESLPTQMADFLLSQDEETTQENINKFKEVWTEALSQEVQNRLKGTTPARASKPTLGASDITKEDFKKMGYKQRVELQESNPELYQLLMA